MRANMWAKAKSVVEVGEEPRIDVRSIVVGSTWASAEVVSSHRLAVPHSVQCTCRLIGLTRIAIVACRGMERSVRRGGVINDLAVLSMVGRCPHPLGSLSLFLFK